GDLENLVTILATEREEDIGSEHVVCNRQHEVHVEVRFGLYVRPDIEFALQLAVNDVVRTHRGVPGVAQEELGGVTTVAGAEIVRHTAKKTAVKLAADAADDTGIVQLGAKIRVVTTR